MRRRYSTYHTNQKTRKPMKTMTHTTKKSMKSNSTQELPSLTPSVERFNSGKDNKNILAGGSAQKNLQRMGFSPLSSPRVTLFMNRASLSPNDFQYQILRNDLESNFRDKVSLQEDWNCIKPLKEHRVRSIARSEEAKKQFQLETITSNRRFPFTLACILQEMLGPIPDLVKGASFVEVGSKVYLYGGKFHGSYFALSIFNPRTHHWRVLSPADPPMPRYGHSTVAFRNNLIVFGGVSGKKKDCAKKLQILDVREMRWTENTGSGMVPATRRHHATATFGKFMLVFGGINSQGDTLDDLQLLDMEFLIWSEPQFIHSIKPSPRSHCTLTAVFPMKSEDAILWCPSQLSKYVRYECGFYLIGGLGAYNEPLNDMWILKFGPKGCWWTSIDVLLPIPKFLHTASYTNHLIVLVGGQPVKSEQDAVRVFNLHKMKWSKQRVIGDFPLCRWEHCAVVHDTKVLVFGGQSDVSSLDRKLQILETDQKTIKHLIIDRFA